jgi:hypothetical protein
MGVQSRVAVAMLSGREIRQQLILIQLPFRAFLGKSFIAAPVLLFT